MAKGTKAPTGITISRNGGTYTVSWKCGDKNYNKGQQFQYKINKGSWVTLSIGTGTRAKDVVLDMANYYPTTETVFSTLTVRIRGKKTNGAWSAWSEKTYTNSVSDVPNLEASLDEQQTNKCTFTWNETTESTDEKPFYHVRWETILVKENDITDGSKLTWDSSQLGWQTGAGSYASSQTITEDTSLLADASYTRWFRVCGRGAGGSSAWRYEKHVYARPYQAQIEEANVTNTDAEGMTCYVRWTADQKPSHPIDYTTVQYLITVPNSNLACPSGAQWSDANISADTADSDAVRFSIDDVLDKDECLFVRVNTIHDSNITYSEPYLTSVGYLKDPTNLSYTPNNTAHTLSSVSVDNNSDVPDSFIVLVYKAGSNPENEIPVGIIAHGASQPLVTPVVCPDWSGETAFTIGAYAAVGTYSANTGLGYTVNVKMRSANTIWVGGAVPVAPNNVNVIQSAISGTATVMWDWTWTNATYAQLSWTDHPDAWESTDEPEIYTIPQARATRWNISGLELGKKWYIAVRLVNGNPEDENAIYGPWSKLTDITLSSVPNIPSLQLSSNVITAGQEITASWDFVSNDGTGQVYAEIKDEDDNLIAHTTIEKEVVINTALLGWTEGETHGLAVRVTSESNRTTDWSNPVSVVIAEALECSIANTSLVAEEKNPRTFSGDLASFISDVEETFAKLEVALQPIQSLNGYSSPWVGGAGKNLLENTSASKIASDITWTVNADGTVSTSGIASATTNLTVGAFTAKANVTYVLSGLPTSVTTNEIFVRFHGPGQNDYTFQNVANYSNGGKIQFSYTSDTSGYVDIRIGNGQNANGLTFKPMICLASASEPTVFAPYSNICPISGRASVDTYRTGANLVRVARAYSSKNGITYTENADGTVHAKGTASAESLSAGNPITYLAEADARCLYTLPIGQYNIRNISGGRIYYQIIKADLSANISTQTLAVGNETNVTLTEPSVIYIRVDLARGTVIDADIEVTVVKGTTALTPYVPWESDKYTTTLGTTVYGGTLDVVSGVLTVTHAIATIGSSSNIGWNSSGWFWWTSLTNKKYGQFNQIASFATQWNSTEALANMPDGYMRGGLNEATVYFKYNDYAGDVNGVKTALTGQTVVYELASPTTTTLTAQQINALLGANNVWSNGGEVNIRITERQYTALKELPLTIDLDGLNSNISATLAIERTENYQMDRPDESKFEGFDGEIVYLKKNASSEISINQDDLLGYLDDEAKYRIFVTFKDIYGQTMSDSIDFEVHWTHQAIIPEADVAIDETNLVAVLTPVAPTGTLTGDTCDIYRLSADKPELIVEGAIFGTDYVDPYPAIGEFGGHRFVFKTANGDYITANNEIAWIDTDAEADDILDIDSTIIDFNGNQLLLHYNVDVGHSWDKDFQETKYLGGSVQGDWNAGVSRTGSISTAMLTLTDAEQIRLMKQLAEYTGPCHVRTKDGSSFTADIQVSEDRDHSDYDAIATFSMTVTRIGAEILDGLTYEQWSQGES